MKIYCVVGTRPEVIKMAPVVKALKKNFYVSLISTGQHREILDQTLRSFNLNPDVDLNLMKSNQSISYLLSQAIERLSNLFIQDKPNVVLAQGDTTTALAAAMACYFNKITFGHIEAGLRSFDIKNPWPEETNRILISKLANYHFCPTDQSKNNLFIEGIKENVFVTGNTCIDSLFMAKKEKKQCNEKQILITIHRRENFGNNLNNVLDALIIISNLDKNVKIKFPVHPNPNILNFVNSKIKNNNNIEIMKPQDYFEFVGLMSSSYIILTDSGGVQEEAPALGVPVLVLRETTERPEAVDAGVVKLIGCDTERIVSEVNKLLIDKEEYSKMSIGSSPYGDGRASERIAKILSSFE